LRITCLDGGRAGRPLEGMGGPNKRGWVEGLEEGQKGEKKRREVAIVKELSGKIKKRKGNREEKLYLGKMVRGCGQGNPAESGEFCAKQKQSGEMEGVSE